MKLHNSRRCAEREEEYAARCDGVGVGTAECDGLACGQVDVLCSDCGQSNIHSKCCYGLELQRRVGVVGLIGSARVKVRMVDSLTLDGVDVREEGNATYIYNNREQHHEDGARLSEVCHYP